jgi:hypothetical protein
MSPRAASTGISPSLAITKGGETPGVGREGGAPLGRDGAQIGGVFRFERGDQLAARKQADEQTRPPSLTRT